MRTKLLGQQIPVDAHYAPELCGQLIEQHTSIDKNVVLNSFPQEVSETEKKFHVKFYGEFLGTKSN